MITKSDRRFRGGLNPITEDQGEVSSMVTVNLPSTPLTVDILVRRQMLNKRRQAGTETKKSDRHFRGGRNPITEDQGGLTPS